MDDIVETSDAMPADESRRSPLQSDLIEEQCSTSAFMTSEPREETESSSHVVYDPEPSNDDIEEDDDDSEEIRALNSAAASLADSDESSDETAAVLTDSQDCAGHDAPGPSSPSGDYLAPLPPLSLSSASVMGRIASGFNTAVSGGLHPLKRSQRVGPEPPSPSPRRPESSASSINGRSLSPKDFFWGPVMPGYPTAQSESDDMKATMVIRQTVQLEQTETSNNDSTGDIGLQQAIPVMPMYLAVICCILNALSPGLGTFIAGVSLACCSRPQRDNVDCASLLFVNVWVAIFQLVSAFLFLIGWIWSLIWGFSFISISREFNSGQKAEEAEVSSSRDETGGGRQDGGVRGVDSLRRTSTTTTTTALTRTTTTTVSLPDEPASAAASAREPPIIILQEAPVAPPHHGVLDAAAAAVWIERMRYDSSRPTATTSAAAAAGADRSAQQPMSRRQRLNRRRQQAAAAAAGGSAAPGPWNDPLTGVLLCPEALEHIVVHSSIVPDHASAAESRSHGPSAGPQTHK